MLFRSGSNGAGKSTFFNAIAGDLRVDSGTIWINHEDVTRLPTWDRSERVARVFQDPMAGTCEALTIEENMALALARGKSRRLRRAIDRQTRELFRERLSVLRLGLENRLGDRIGLLSGGQRQAVSLLMASLRPSSILLLDEHTITSPTSSSRMSSKKRTPTNRPCASRTCPRWAPERCMAASASSTSSS